MKMEEFFPDRKRNIRSGERSLLPDLNSLIRTLFSDFNISEGNIPNGIFIKNISLKSGASPKPKIKSVIVIKQDAKTINNSLYVYIFDLTPPNSKIKIINY